MSHMKRRLMEIGISGKLLVIYYLSDYLNSLLLCQRGTIPKYFDGAA